jgi:capsular exopolysaccharide synthesis family protein
MTFEQFLMKLIKRWKLVVICIVIVGVGAYIGSKLMTPIYQSTALVQIAIRSNLNQADINSLNASNELVPTEAKLAVSDAVLGEVATHYPGLTVQGLSKEVTSTPTLNTQIFEIDVQDKSPTRAADLANDIAATLIKQEAQFDQKVSIQTQQQMQNDLAHTQQLIDSIVKQIEVLKKTPGNDAKIASLNAQLSTFETHFILVEQQLSQVEQTVVQNGNFIRVVQSAQPVWTPLRPNKLLNTGAGLLAGLLLGMSLALLFERLDTRVRTPEALNQLLGWPALATIWQVNSSKGEAVICPTGHNANVERYRILRMNVGFSAIDKPLRTILVTSAGPRDGRSVVAANLAFFMARAGKNTMLIDADLRNPTQHEKFGIPADAEGLSNAILAFSSPTTANAPDNEQSHTSTSPTVTRVSLDSFIHAADIPNLCVMPAGPLPPNPSELLDSKAMKHVLTALGNGGAEVVIFDTPPLLGLSDTSILASQVDGTLVVVDITRANRRDLKEVKALLGQAGAHVLGVVVNKQPHSRDHAIYSYYDIAHEQTGNNSHGRKNGHTAPVTPYRMKEPETEPQEDLLDRTVILHRTVKRGSVHATEVNTQSEQHLADSDTEKSISVYQVRPETQTRPELLDERKDGESESGS